jgi:hypothetical protein
MSGLAKRRWVRFSLRSALVALAVVSVWFGWNVHRVRQREAALRYLQRIVIVELGSAENPARPWRDVPVVWRWLGAKPVLTIPLPEGSFTEEDREALEALFPEATVQLPRPAFGGMGGP